MSVGTDRNASGRPRAASLAAIIRGGEEPGPLHSASRKVEMVAVSQLVPYKANARIHSRQQIQKIAESIRRFGFCNPILIDDNYQVIAGHGRVEAAKLLGLTDVPTLRIDHLSAAEKRAFTIADNRLAELADWDLDTLADELGALLDLEFEVELTGFDLGEIQTMLDAADEDLAENDGAEDNSAEDEIKQPQSSVPVSRAGDEWLLGEHRLICARAGEPGVYTSADHAIRSWQTFAGHPARLAGAAKTFAQIEQERKTAHSQSASEKREAA
jgi:ParB-like chromosome segregation protein Spo0J